jgi:PAS domain S-box-containing protein
MSDKDNRHDESPPSTGSAEALRRRAEEVAAGATGRQAENLDALSLEEISRTFHELRVHQIELEMQNEELRETQLELDAARARYFDLYDLAPVGYFTVSVQGIITDANLTSAAQTGLPRTSLLKQPFSQFVEKEDQDLYYRCRKRLLESEEPQEESLRMKRDDGSIFWAHLSATVARDDKGGVICRVVTSDITGQKRAEQKIEAQLEELRRWEEVTLGREDRVQELKREVNELCRRAGQPIRYPSQEENPDDLENRASP